MILYLYLLIATWSSTHILLVDTQFIEFFFNMRKGVLCFQIRAVTADRTRGSGEVEVAYAFKSLL